MSETFKNTIAVLIALAFASAVGYAFYNGNKVQETADRNCGPFKRVTWFKDAEGQIHSVCMNAEDKYVIKP